MRLLGRLSATLGLAVAVLAVLLHAWLAPSWLEQAAAQLGSEAMHHLPAHHLSLAPRLPFHLWPRFSNPWPTWPGDKGVAELVPFMLQMRALGAPDWGFLSWNRRPSLLEMSEAFPIVPPDAAALAQPPASAVQAMWLGHASLLVQLEGLTFLTDPHFSQRSSPVQALGPRRAVQPALTPEDAAFPEVDAVLLSHNHFDHLDAGSVRRLHKRFGTRLAWFVPLGMARWFNRRGITNVTELDWWQEAAVPGSQVRVALTPSQHWSARGLFDRRATLWGGWAVLGARLRFWFAGDTGYCPVFPEIGQRLGPFDLAAIPIGAYAPRSFMRALHVGPQEAVRIHYEVRSKRSIGIHCCTFWLTTEPLDEPPRLLAEEAAKAGLPPEAFVVLKHGGRLQTAGGRDLNSPQLLAL